MTAPRLGLGTFQLEGASCERTVRCAIEIGYRHIDTAEGYGNEEAIGRALAGLDRDPLFLTSKAGHNHLEPKRLHESCEGSLRRLRTTHLDLYLVHWPNSAIPIERTTAALENLRMRGLIRGWGVSNFTERHLETVLDLGMPATNQIEIHPYFRQPRLTAWCGARDLPLTAYSPLARGLVLHDRVLQTIGMHHGRSAAQIALRWALQRGHLAIVKASSEHHLAENLAVFDFELTPAEMRRINGLPRGDRRFDFEWSEFNGPNG